MVPKAIVFPGEGGELVPSDKTRGGWKKNSMGVRIRIGGTPDVVLDRDTLLTM